MPSGSIMANQIRNGRFELEAVRSAWSRLPHSEDAAEDGGYHIPTRDSRGGLESLDYEVVENEPYKADRAQRRMLYVGYIVFVKWFFALLIGIGTGLSAFFINIAVENFAGWKFAATFAIIKHSYFAGFLVYMLFNLALVFSSVFIVTHFAPAAAGSGIPEIKGYLNGIDTPGILLFRTLIGKIFGSIGSVGGGLALGKEGPLVHTGACIASLIGQAMFYFLAIITYGTAVPSGQFVPGIMIGSTYGRLVGMFVVKVYKKLNVEEGTYALLGAASFLGGSMRMTVSLCVIMVEITNNLQLLPLIMLVLLISKAVGDVFNGGFYEEQARLRGIPLLESRPKQYMRNMIAKEACVNQKVAYFPRVVKVGDVVAMLQSNSHNGFPVIDHLQNGETVVIGLILRSYLLVVLQLKADFQHIPVPSDTRGSLSTRHSVTDFVKPASSKGLSINDIYLTQDEMEMYIDLRPFVNPSPYVVPEDMSLTKVYNLFRQLGLRHIFVVPCPSRVIGMITRKDLLSEEKEDSDATELPPVSIRYQGNEIDFGGGLELDRPLLNDLLAHE